MFVPTKKKVNIGSIFPVRDFTYVKDTVNGFIKIAESENSIGTTINIGSGKGIKIKDLFYKLCFLTNKKASLVLDTERIRPKKSEVSVLVCSNKKAKKILNWKPLYSFESGLQDTIQYIEKNLNKYKTNIYNL